MLDANRRVVAAASLPQRIGLHISCLAHALRSFVVSDSVAHACSEQSEQIYGMLVYSYVCYQTA